MGHKRQTVCQDCTGRVTHLWPIALPPAGPGRPFVGRSRPRAHRPPRDPGFGIPGFGIRDSGFGVRGSEFEVHVRVRKSVALNRVPAFDAPDPGSRIPSPESRIPNPESRSDPSGRRYTPDSFFSERAISVMRCPYSRAALTASVESVFAGTTTMPAQAAAA